MNPTEGHAVACAPILEEGPCFVTPVFAATVSNQLWMQDLDDDGNVQAFVAVDPDHPGLVPIRNSARSVVRQPGIFGFRPTNGMVTVGHRENLEPLLRYSFVECGGKPYLRRSIARFLRDRTLIQEAEEELSTSGRRTGPQLTMDSLPELTQHVHFHEAVENAALRHIMMGQSIFIPGAAGSGKTTLLAQLAIATANSDIENIVVHASLRSETNAAGILARLLEALEQWAISKGEGAHKAQRIMDWKQLASMAVAESQGGGSEVSSVTISSIVARLRTDSRFQGVKVTIFIDDIDESFDETGGESWENVCRLLDNLMAGKVILVLAGRRSIVGSTTLAFDRLHHIPHLELGSLSLLETRQFLQRANLSGVDQGALLDRIEEWAASSGGVTPLMLAMAWNSLKAPGGEQRTRLLEGYDLSLSLGAMLSGLLDGALAGIPSGGHRAAEMILTILSSVDSMNVEALVAKMRERKVSISTSTIYNALNRLADAGFIVQELRNARVSLAHAVFKEWITYLDGDRATL